MQCTQASYKEFKVKKEAGKEASKKVKRALDMIERLLRAQIDKTKADDISSTGKE